MCAISTCTCSVTKNDINSSGATCNGTCSTCTLYVKIILTIAVEPASSQGVKARGNGGQCWKLVYIQVTIPHPSGVYSGSKQTLSLSDYGLSETVHHHLGDFKCISGTCTSTVHINHPLSLSDSLSPSLPPSCSHTHTHKHIHTQAHTHTHTHTHTHFLTHTQMHKQNTCITRTIKIHLNRPCSNEQVQCTRIHMCAHKQDRLSWIIMHEIEKGPVTMSGHRSSEQTLRLFYEVALCKHCGGKGHPTKRKTHHKKVGCASCTTYIVYASRSYSYTCMYMYMYVRYTCIIHVCSKWQRSRVLCEATCMYTCKQR